MPRDGGTDSRSVVNPLADLSEDAIVVCSDIDGLPTDADIEDLFDTADYLRLFNWAFGANVKAADLPATEQPIVKKLTDLRGDFDHALPAHALTMHREEFFAAVKPKTLTQFSALFKRLNVTLPE